MIGGANARTSGIVWPDDAPSLCGQGRMPVNVGALSNDVSTLGGTVIAYGRNITIGSPRASHRGPVVREGLA